MYSEDRAWADIGNARCPQSTGLPPRPPAQVPLQVTAAQSKRILRAAPGSLGRQLGCLFPVGCLRRFAGAAQASIEVTAEQTRSTLRAAPGPARVPLALNSPASGQAAVGGTAQARLVEQPRQPPKRLPGPRGVPPAAWRCCAGGWETAKGMAPPPQCPFALYGVWAAPTGETGAKAVIVYPLASSPQKRNPPRTPGVTA